MILFLSQTNINYFCKRFTHIFTLLVGTLLYTSCTKVEDYDNTPTGNFEALWHIIDKNYCFFDYKAEEYGLDWDAVYQKYKPRIDDRMSNAGLFEVLGDMLDELRDGHVNLYAAHDVARYWNFHEGYATNFSEEIQKNYLGTDYKIASSLRYTILPDNIGYIYVSSFSNSIGEGNLDECLNALALCRGLIIDVRNNGGGFLTELCELLDYLLPEGEIFVSVTENGKEKIWAVSVTPNIVRSQSGKHCGRYAVTLGPASKRPAVVTKES